LKLYLILLCALLVTPCFAFKFTPMSLTIIPKEDRSALITLTNDKETPVPIELSITTREMSADGKEDANKKTGEFTLFPNQMVLEPGQKRKVKVTWNGLVDLPSELAYRIIAEELPVDLGKAKKEKANIKILIKYVGALYVAPADAKSKVAVDSAITDPQKKTIEIDVSNKGSEHQVLKNLSISIKTGKNEYKLKGDELLGMDGENILAGKSRHFTLTKLPMPISSLPQKFEVTLQYDE